jgi:hypothetical protein
VLRFNVALQPGMSGGPIVNANGAVIGIVAGGLKAGAAPASWGWPSEWISGLLASTEATGRPVRVAGVYYTLSDLQSIAKAVATGRRIKCGTLEFEFRGRRSFSEVARGTDDKPRLQHIVNVSTLPQDEIDQLAFDIWTHLPSGATAVSPAGYDLVNENDVCVARSKTGPFQQVLWATAATNPAEIQAASVRFEVNVMAPRVGFTLNFNYDPQLTTVQLNGMPGPQFRENNMVFNRKGMMYLKGLPVPGTQTGGTQAGHVFETLVAKGGTFLGVGTVNDELPPQLSACVQTGNTTGICVPAIQHLKEWTHFILATQLSTYPVY